MKYLGYNLDTVWKHVNDIHADLKVNDGFKLQLMQYEKKINGTNTLDFYAKRTSRKPVRYQNNLHSMR